MSCIAEKENWLSLQSFFQHFFIQIFSLRKRPGKDYLVPLQTILDPTPPFYHLEIDLKSLVCIFKKIKTKTGTKTEYFRLQLIFFLHQIIASLIAIYIWYIFALWAQSWQISLSGHQMLKCRFMPESPSFQGYLRLVGN